MLRKPLEKLASRATGVYSGLTQAYIAHLERKGLRVGEQCHLGAGVFLDPDFCFLIEIEDNATITRGVTILAHDASIKAATGYTRIAPVRIGRGAFIGLMSVILPGVTIGEGAIVGAGSVVTHDVEPHTIVGGAPAKVIADRDSYVARHKEQMKSRPVWPRDGWANSTGIDDEKRAQMLAALNEVGEGYIE